MNFRKVEDLTFNIDEMKEENQKHMKEILQHQQTDKVSKYLKVMNGFYYDSRL